MKKLFNFKFTKGIFMILAVAFLLSCSNKNKLHEQAEQLYKQGIELMNTGGVPNLMEAINLFKKSVEIDSSFARSYASMSIAYANLGGLYNYLAPGKTWPEAIPAADKAVALDEKLADGYLAKAYIEQYYNWNWEEMGKNLKRALDLEPDNVFLLLQNAGYLATMNKTEESQILLNKAQQLAPDSPMVNNYLMNNMIYNREFEKVKPLVKKEINANPQNGYLYWKMATLCSKEGTYEEAVNYLNIQIPLMNGDINDEVALLGYNYGRLGLTAEAQAQLAKLDELAGNGMYVSPVGKAWIYAGLNNKDEAIACLQKGYEEHAFRMGLDLIYSSFIFESIADDPRYQELLKKMKL